MGLNHTNGNMYADISDTWNPLGGECPHKCSYCSTHKLFRYPVIKEKYTGLPRVYEKELKTNLKANKKIFVVAQNDLFADEINQLDIIKILDYCYKFPTNQYYFQTKNPKRILEIQHPVFEQSFIGTTIESNIYYQEHMGNAPKPVHRAIYMNNIRIHYKTYVTVEPIMDFDLSTMLDLLYRCHPQFIYIGADSGKNNLPEPSKEKILELIKHLEEFTVVHKKSNLNRLLK